MKYFVFRLHYGVESNGKKFCRAYFLRHDGKVDQHQSIFTTFPSKEIAIASGRRFFKKRKFHVFSTQDCSMVHVNDSAVQHTKV